MKTQWDLSKIYAGFDDPAMARDFERLEETVQSARTLLSGDEAPLNRLRGMVGHLGEIASLSGALQNMAELTLAVDAGNAPATKAFDRLMQLSVRVDALKSAFARYVGELPNLSDLIDSDPLLAENAYALHRYALRARHALNPAIEEAVLTMKITGGRAWEKLRDALESEHTLDYLIDGEQTRITLVEARNLAFSPDADVRKAAYEAEIAGYAAIETPMAACLSAVKGEALSMAKWTNFDSVLDWSLFESHMTRETLEALLTAIRESLPMFRKYLRAKAKALGHAGGLPFYDLFAPLGAPEDGFSPEASEGMLTRVLGAFSPEMGKMIRQSFDEGLIDLYPHSGKQGGAFCSGVYRAGVSYVLSNHDDTFYAVSTLAHELGHAFHDRQLFKNGPLAADAPMPLAETASIFNETLLSEALMKDAAPQKKIALLNQQLTDATQTVADIYSRFLFEQAVLRERAQHSLGAKDFCRLMREAQMESYGDGLSEDALHPYMWACKIHYYSPDYHFYNYPYAFGLLFSKGLFAEYQKRGAAFEPQYRRLLGDMARYDVEDVARLAGIDVTSLDFWRGSLKVIGQSVDAFCEAVEG